MAGNGYWNSNWLVENTQRAYPLQYGHQATDTTAAVTIPENLLAAAQITLVYYFPSTLYISKVSYIGDFIELQISGYPGAFTFDAGTTLGTVTIPTNAADFSVFQIVPTTAGLREIAGNITIGSLETVLNWPSGVFSFAPTATRLEFDVVRPSVPGLRSLKLLDGDSVTTEIIGKAVLKAGANIKLALSANLGYQAVTISAVSDANYSDGCTCDAVAIGAPIRQINGVSPDSNGNINLLGAGCYEFKTQTAGLQIINTCNDPCCGCDQLDAVFVEVKKFVDGATDLKEYASRLRQAIDRLETVVLVSGNIGGCTTP